MLKSLTLAALAIAVPTAVCADIGPKPTIAFRFSDGAGVQIADGQLLECDDARCAAPKPMPQMGPQTFSCEPTSCSGRAYGFPHYLELALTLSDGRRLTSAPFAKTRFDQTFTVTVRRGALRVAPAR
jgi:hypothetical protein